MQHIVEWKPEYNIGEKVVDLEHQHLFKMAKEALHIDLPKHKKEKIQALIKELFKYTRVHFHHEEEYMKKVGFPKLKEHIEEHKLIISELTAFLKACESMSIDEIEKTLAEFIQINIVHHIVVEDKKIHFWTSSANDIIDQVGWKPFYELNITQIDEEHKQLFEIAKRALHQTDSIDNIKQNLRELCSYMLYHFKNEEEYMELIGYPQLEQHKEIHQKVIHDLNTFMKSLVSEGLKNYKKKLALFIEIWLVNHMFHEDRKILTWKNRKDD